MDNLQKLLNKLEEDIDGSNMLGLFQIGIALKVMEDRLWNIDTESAQRCNDLQHKLLNDSN